MTRTLFLVHQYRQAGYKGFYHAANELPPDCEVTPWLITRWLIIFIKGFQRAHHILSIRFTLWDIGSHVTRKKEMACLQQYFSAVAMNKSSPSVQDVVLAVIWYGNQTHRHLFGTTSSRR
jgi:hypothetical protein